MDSNSLSAETVADVLVGRQSQLAKLRACVAPMLQDHAPLNAWLCGPPGTGKTTLARRVIGETCDGASMIGAYVNCWEHRSLYGVLRMLLDQLKILGAEAQDTGVKLDRARQAFRGHPAVIVLDRIDRLMPAQRADIICGLLALPKTGLICIANSTRGLAAIKEDVRSHLSPVLVRVEPYSVKLLETILTYRAYQALASDSWTQPVLRRIAEVANGDARLAIQILRQAAAAAERAGSPRVNGRFADDLARQWRAIHEEQRLAGLTEHERIIHELAKQHAPLGSVELTRLYVRHCGDHKIQPMAGRTFRKYLSRLASAGILTVSQAPMSRRGRLVSLNATR